MKTHHSVTLRGVSPFPVTVSAQPCDRFEVHGLSEVATRETRARVASALSAWSVEARARVLIEGAEGSCPSADLAVAVAALDAMGLLGANVPHPTLLGELALNGRLRPVRGIYAMVRDPDGTFIVPQDQIGEACAAPKYRKMLSASNLWQVVEWFRGQLPEATETFPEIERLSGFFSTTKEPDTSKLGNAILIVGKTGIGKSLLARNIAVTLPVPPPEVQAEILTIRSVAGLWGDFHVPFRAPHYTVSEAGLLGGGERVRPGEVSLAHGGCLLLDEVCEFRHESLRQLARIVAEGHVSFVRGHGRGDPQSVTLPAKPALVIGTCEPRDFELARAAYPWTGVYEATPGEVERVAEIERAT